MNMDTELHTCKKINEETSVDISVNSEQKISPENSEYDSVESYSEDEGQPIKARSRASDLDSHSGSDSVPPREEGDGQESTPAKKVDDDEDKKNPQYIPKRGTFYEHDDRTADDQETTEQAVVENPEKDKKKVWNDKKERWTHDKFNDNEQVPKSRSELISIYGYDIRNEDGPPRARRRRRYGRGPNKYTRNWEDEDAYNKIAPVTNKRSSKPRDSQSIEEFPPINSGTSSSTASSINHHSNKMAPKREININRNNGPHNSSVEVQPPKATNNRSNSNHNANQMSVKEEEKPAIRNNGNQQRVAAGRPLKPKKEIPDSDYHGFTTKTRQQRIVRTEEQKILPTANNPFNKREGIDYIQSQNFTNKNSANIQELEKNLNNLSVQDGGHQGAIKQNQPLLEHNVNRQGSVPPRLQPDQQKGPKRYSSMRQRSLPETSAPPAPNFPHSFYPNDYNSQAPPPATHQPIMHPSQGLQNTQLPPPPLAPLPQQVAVTAAPILQAQFPPPFPQPSPAFLQANVPPTAYIPQQTPQIINYVQSQPAYAPSYQGYQQQFNPVQTQPTELYQPQGGITYYSTDQQQLVPRPAQKRPKAAIPIVAPNDLVNTEQREFDVSRSFQEDGSVMNEYHLIEAEPFLE